MAERKVFLVLFVVLALFACKPQEQKQLVWSDEFDSTAVPDSTKWSYELGDGCPNVCGWGNNEWEFYTKDPKNVRIENGMLIIEALKDSMQGKPFTSTKLVSKSKGDWLYGRIEVKARLPRGKGTWPAIWMLPTDWKYGGWPASGEIDIMEHVGFDPGVVHGTIHTESYNHTKGTQKGSQITIADGMDEFHVYAIQWTSDKIDFLVDDSTYYSVTHQASDTYKEWPFDQKFYLIMNVAVGGDWGGQKGVDMDIWPQKMEIDYVRIYK